MLPAKQLNPATAEVISIPAPTLGWNRRDALSSMKAGYAVKLDNWFPLPDSIQFRFGSVDWSTGLDAHTLITYRPKSGNQELWAFADDSIYDVSSDGAVGAAAVSSLTNDTWACQNYATTGGNYLICLNGVDDMELYDGSAWEAINAGSLGVSITNVLTSDLVNLFVHKERLFYIEKQSMSAWYPIVGAIGGALTELDLSSVFSKGGFLVAGGTWSTDAGDGRDDYACFLTSEGELAVYQGTDPADATAWSLIGVFTLGKPIGTRCTLKYGGDLLILTVDGVISAAEAFQAARDQQAQLAVTDTIQAEVAEKGALYKDTAGWQMTHFSEAQMLLVNVPESDGVKQWVMNTVTKAWGRFLDWEATCFEVFNGALYFAIEGAVRKGWTGVNDNGESIVGDVLPAFSVFKKNGIAKQFTMLQPIMQWDSNPLSMKLGFDVDYLSEDPTQEIALQTGSAGNEWDSGDWDVAIWIGSLTTQKEWYTVAGFGIAGAPHLVLESATSSARITTFNAIMQPGSVF